jgi:hypothetical protein
MSWWQEARGPGVRFRAGAMLGEALTLSLSWIKNDIVVLAHT